jgi:hypothetical protein
MRIVTVLIFVVLQIPGALGQAYMSAAGLRVGTDWGLTVQQRLTKSATLEGIVQSSLQREEIMLTVLAEQHYPVLFRGLNLYFGGGAHKGWLSKTSKNEEVLRNTENPLGITLVGGAELTIGRLNISYDFKPSLNIKGGEEAFYPQTGISIRYVLLDNKVYKDMVKQRKKDARSEKNKQNQDRDKWKFWKKKDK